jgi:hypothetical protein
MKNAIMFAMGMLLTSTGIASAIGRPVSTVQQQLYVWSGQFVSLDQSARVATFNARVPPHVEKYVDRFKPDNRLILVWNMIGKTEADSVLALWQLDGEKHPGLDIGYVLPIEFVSADPSSHTVTFKVPLTNSALKSLTSVTAGQWVKVQTPMVQAPHVALIASIKEAAAPSADGGRHR